MLINDKYTAIDANAVASIPMNTELLDEFITFAKEEYGLTVEVVESDTPDSFEKIFGCRLSEK